VIHTDARFEKAVAETVARIEQRTDAEIVVVAAERSGTYRDVAMTWAAVAAFVLLLIILFSPWSWPPVLVAFDVGVIFPALSWALDTRWAMSRLAPAARRREQVRAMAEAEFVREVVHGTPNRTGLLVYVSALESAVEVIPDVGITGRIAPGALVPAIKAFDEHDLDGFLKALEALGDVLARGVPHVEGVSDAFDLPDAPRVRP
jgi:putative membrane protein